MRESTNKLVLQVREIWKQFGAPQRFSVAMSLVVTLLVLGGLLYWGTRPDFRVLYSNLSLADASQMREKLEEAKIPVQISQSGMTIRVPAAKLYEARLMLASSGLPKDTSTGFELFEEPKFGLTDFAQKVNYQRALQGELERTISAMQGIRSARVMLVLPKDHLFASEEDRIARGSVLLSLNGGTVSDAQVRSIVHLMASSVQRLDPVQVTVTDEAGHLLTQPNGIDDVAGSGSKQLDVQERAEQRLVEKAQDILDRALGTGNSIVRVNVDMDFSDTEQRNEMYDAENRVATSEKLISEDKTVGGGGGRGGGSGMVANVSVGQPDNMRVDSSGNKDTTEEIYTEYAVPSNVSIIRQKGIRIEHLSVAVCIAEPESGPRSKEEIEAISQLVSNALGVNSTRSDTVHVTEMKFQAPEPMPEPKWWEQLPLDYNSLVKSAGGLAALIFVMVAGKKAKAVLLASAPSMEVPISEANEHEQEQLREEEPLETGQRIDAMAKLARDNPKTMAAWITNAADWNANNA